MNEEHKLITFDVHTRLCPHLWNAITTMQPAFTQVDQPTYYRVATASLSHVAAACAVDVGMTEDQFIDVCRATYVEACGAATRWG